MRCAWARARLEVGGPAVQSRGSGGCDHTRAAPPARRRRRPRPPTRSQRSPSPGPDRRAAPRRPRGPVATVGSGGDLDLLVEARPGGQRDQRADRGGADRKPGCRAAEREGSDAGRDQRKHHQGQGPRTQDERDQPLQPSLPSGRRPGRPDQTKIGCAPTPRMIPHAGRTCTIPRDVLKRKWPAGAENRRSKERDADLHHAHPPDVRQVKTLKDNPTQVHEVTKEVEQLGVKSSTSGRRWASTTSSAWSSARRDDDGQALGRDGLARHGDEQGADRNRRRGSPPRCEAKREAQAEAGRR